jgi:hypothetical protein
MKLCRRTCQRRRHPADHRVPDLALDVCDRLPGRALVPLSRGARSPVRSGVARLGSCRAERLIPAHHQAFGNAFFRLPPESAGLARPRFGPTAQFEKIGPALDRVLVASGGSGVRTERDYAVADGIDLLEDEARRRALEGSDKLLMFILQRRRPEVWAPPKPNRPRDLRDRTTRAGEFTPKCRRSRK